MPARRTFASYSSLTLSHLGAERLKGSADPLIPFPGLCSRPMFACLEEKGSGGTERKAEKREIRLSLGLYETSNNFDQTRQ